MGRKTERQVTYTNVREIQLNGIIYFLQSLVTEANYWEGNHLAFGSLDVMTKKQRGRWQIRIPEIPSHTLLNMKIHEVESHIQAGNFIRLPKRRSQMETTNVLEKFWDTIALLILQRTPTQSMQITNYIHNARLSLLVGFPTWKKSKIGKEEYL